MDLNLSQAGQGIFFRHCPVNTVHHLYVCPVQSGREELEDRELRKTPREPLLMARCLLLPAQHSAFPLENKAAVIRVPIKHEAS